MVEALIIDKGLTIQLDSEAAEESKKILQEATVRLARKNSTEEALRREKEKIKQRDDWTRGYIEILSYTCKLSDLYAKENHSLNPGYLAVVNPHLNVPHLSEGLNQVIHEMKQYSNSIQVKSKVEKKLKKEKKRKKKGKRGENPEESEFTEREETA